MIAPGPLLTYWIVAAIFYFSNLIAATAQIILTNPSNHQVFQRDLKDSALISISGYMHCPYLSVRVTLIPNQDDQMSIDSSLNQGQMARGNFHLQMPAAKGWHRLLVQGQRADGPIDTTIVERVGVGEIFLVAGNSNAMGVQGLGAKQGLDHVVVFDTINKVLDPSNITVAEDQPLQHPIFSPIRAHGFTFPAGETSWIWGELGDMLYERLGTPVLFFNAGWAAANSNHYRETAEGKNAFNHYVGKYWPNRQPYSNIKNTLRYFHSWLGLRAVLWSHGENDAYDLGMDRQTYFNNIQYLIDQSRQDFGKAIPWVIGQSTVTWRSDQPFWPVRTAQKDLGTLPGYNTWLGADTDSVQVPRPAHGHFENVPGGIQGISQAAQAWNRNLSNDFFSSIEPLLPNGFLFTGMVPASSSPGAYLFIPFDLQNVSIARKIEAELLTAKGQYIATLGSGDKSPLYLQLPKSLPAASYVVRLVTADKQIIGNISAPILIGPGKPTQLTRGLNVRAFGDGIYISWLSSPHPNLKEVILLSSNDQRNFKPLQTFTGLDNRAESKIYSYLDKTPGDRTVYYQIRRIYTDGTEENGGIIAAFRGDTPPTYRVFPNPVSGNQFFVRPLENGYPETIELYDIQGRQHPIQIDLQTILGLIEIRSIYPLPLGNYIIRLEKEGKLVSQTLTIE